MFPLEYPLHVLRDAPRRSRVLDPFCGRGTTLYAARLLGLHAYGVDTNPVAVAIAKAKLVDTTAEQVIQLARNLLAVSHCDDVPEGEFWSICYHPTTLRAICQIREGLQHLVGKPAVMLRAVLLGILHGPLRKGMPSYLSNQLPRTFAPKPQYSVRYWQKHGLENPPEIDVLDVITRKVQRILNEIPTPVAGHILCADARTLPLLGPFDYIVTSPPYYGMNTYRADQWLRYWFLGYPPEVPYSDQTQVSRGGLEGFIHALADVWHRVGELAHRGSQLCVRFGSVPSEPIDPEYIFRATLNSSEMPWRIMEITEVPPLQRKTRQSVQMGARGHRNAAAREVDIVAVLD